MSGGSAADSLSRDSFSRAAAGPRAEDADWSIMFTCTDAGVKIEVLPSLLPRVVGP
jgi:hypothetical protein